MAKKPRPTKGVPEAVFQRELFKYLQRKDANPGKNVDASFLYKGTKFTFERGNGPYHSGYQIKKSADQAAKEMQRTERKNSIKLSDGEKMFMQTYYDVAAERNISEGRTGNNKLEVDHVEPRSKGGPHHPYNMRLMERGNNIAKSNRQGGFGKFESLLALDKHLGILDQINSLIAWRNGDNAMSNFLNASLDFAADRAGPVGQIANAAFTELVDEPVRQATGEGVFDAIPNGSQEERRAKNGKTNADLKKYSSGKGNGAAHAVSNEIEYMAKKFANGQLPYNGD